MHKNSTWILWTLSHDQANSEGARLILMFWQMKKIKTEEIEEEILREIGNILRESRLDILERRRLFLLH